MRLLSFPLLFVLALALLAACSGGPDDPDGGRADAATDGGGDGGLVDAGLDGGDGGEVRSLLSITPDTGPVGGGTPVELVGTGFEASVRVEIGGTNCAGIVVVSPTRASCTTGPGTLGLQDVEVQWGDGGAQRLPQAFTYVDEPAVDYCHLQFPASITAAPDQSAGPVYGWVFQAGVTDGAGQGTGITAQLGIGPDGTTPDGSWTWTSASYNTDAQNTAGALANDEYQAELVAPSAEGDYDYAYRFSNDAGGRWLYCDLESAGGSTDGYDPGGAGALTVRVSQNPPEWCNTQFPKSITGKSAGTVVTVYGQVFEPGLTDVPGPSPSILAELGVGPDGSNPSIDPSTWQWQTAAYNASCADCGSNHEYQSDLTLATGTFDYAFRFSIDGGSSWAYCDTDSLANGYDPALAGDLVVP